MPVEKKQDAQASKDEKSQQQTKKDESKATKTMSSMAKSQKPKPQSIFGVIFTWLFIMLLGFIFMSLLAVIVVIFDFLGIIRVRDFLPGMVLENQYVKDYIRESSIIKSSEESKIKALIHEQEESYSDFSGQLKRKEVELEEKLVKLAGWEKELRDRELDVIAKESDLAKKVREFEESKRQKITSDQALEQFARVYERMDPQLAADALTKLDNPTVINIITKMKEKKGAAILEKMPAEKVSQITDELKKFTKPSNGGDTAENLLASSPTGEVGVNK